MSATRFAMLRTITGVYFLCFIYVVWSDARVIYGGDETAIGFSPNWLRYELFAGQLELHLIAMAILSLMLAFGLYRRVVAAVLLYTFGCLFTLSELNSVANAYTSWMIAAFLIVPAGEPWSLDRHWRGLVVSTWSMPRTVYWGAWIVFATSYSASGIDKWLFADRWRDGGVMLWFMESALARTNPVARMFTGIIDGQPAYWISRMVIIAEGLALPLMVHRCGRLLVWVSLTLMHVGVLMLVNIPHTTTGLLLFHLFIFDERWLRRDYWRGEKASAM